MARTTLAALITQVRLLAGDPAGASATFSDDDLQVFLDAHATPARYISLTPEATIAPGGGAGYYTWTAPFGWWEAEETLTDSSYNALAPTTSDRQRGRWTFSASQSAVLLTGTYYDVHLAAADVADAWIAKLKLSYDFAADGGDYKRSQMLAGLQALAASLRAKAGNGGALTAELQRWDA